MSDTGESRKSGRQEPPRNLRISTRDNADFKWKADKSVIGALEMVSSPSLSLEPRAKMEEHQIPTVLEELEECQKIWKEHKLHKSFAEAVEGIPPEMKCCGMISDPEGSIMKLVPLLNIGWAKKVSDDYFKEKGYRVSCFVWTWSNISGATENVKLLIRFHTLTETKRHGFKK